MKTTASIHQTSEPVRPEALQNIAITAVTFGAEMSPGEKAEWAALDEYERSEWSSWARRKVERRTQRDIQYDCWRDGRLVRNVYGRLSPQTQEHLGIHLLLRRPLPPFRSRASHGPAPVPTRGSRRGSRSASSSSDDPDGDEGPPPGTETSHVSEYDRLEVHRQAMAGAAYRANIRDAIRRLQADGDEGVE